MSSYVCEENCVIQGSFYMYLYQDSWSNIRCFVIVSFFKNSWDVSSSSEQGVRKANTVKWRNIWAYQKFNKCFNLHLSTNLRTYMSSPPPLLRSVVENNLEVAVPIGLRRRAKDRPAPPRVASRRRANTAGPPGTIFIFILTHFQNKVDVKNDKKVARIVYRESTKM